ncbi:MAG TPA: enterochelin esterase, partial [Planctomycetes bacterium]|nr:enterochelin esterase [Planctomycetota bacterium]
MSLAIQEITGAAHLARADIERFFETHEFPIVEGTRVTFVFREERDAPPPESVAIRHWIQGLPSAQEMVPIPGTGIWHCGIDLPEGSRVEYKIELRFGERSILIQDPLNPHLARDPYGANSVVHGTGYEVPDWIHEDPQARKGEMRSIRIRSAAFGETRRIQVYEPARFREARRYPLLLVHDGSDFLRFSDLRTVLDNLIHRLEVAPMVVAFLDPGDRLHEYADDPRQGRFLAEEVLAALEERYPLVPRPAARGLVGASFGAVASLSAAWRHPGVFGNLFLLSGSFAFTDIGDHEKGPAFDPVVSFVNAFRENPGRPAERVFLTCGTYESPIYYNRSLAPVLQATGMDVKYLEARDGHNWENWRDRMREGLSWLFPGP